MPFCRKCGGIVNENEDACPHCGAKTANKKPVTTTGMQNQPAQGMIDGERKITEGAEKRNKTGLLCPKCGSHELQTIVEVNTETKGSGFSASKGCCGYMMLGPIGLLCGACGSGTKTTTTNTTYFHCMNCGEKFRKPSDLRADAEKARSSAKAGLIAMIVSAILVFFILMAVGGGEPAYTIGGLIGAVVLVITGIALYFSTNSSADNMEAEAGRIEKKMKSYRE